MTRYGRERRATVTVQSLHIVVADTTGSVTREEVVKWLAEENIAPIGRPIDSVDVHSIERVIGSQPEVSHASAWTDLDGVVTVRVEPRHPLMRIITTNGYRFWFSADGYILPDRGDYTAHVPIVTGNISFPFGPSAEGSYTRMQEANYRDFLERFTALETERQELRARLASTRSEIRAVRLSAPKRWWGKARKEGFALTKAAHFADLEKQRIEIETSIAKIDDLGHELREKEKKSYQSHRFLSKLANFVGFIARDRFWNAQIVQINVVGDNANNSQWTEPQIELIPRAGDHIVLLGELDGTERRRLENLRLFYDKALRYEGWNEYRYINIKYGNQIVCTK
jgi:cell division protein FtsQ